MNARDRRKDHCANRGFRTVKILRIDSQIYIRMNRVQRLNRGWIENKTILIKPDGNVLTEARALTQPSWLDRFLSY